MFPLELENEFNNKNDIVKRSNYISNLLLYFIDWGNKNKKTLSLLNINDIKKINTLLLEGSNISGIIPLSKFFNIEDSFKEEFILNNNDDILYNNILLNNSENDIDESNEINSESNEESEEVIDNDNNIFIMDQLNENKDLCFNIQKCIKTFDLEELKKLNLKLDEHI